MSTPVAVIPLTYDTHDVQDLDGIYLELVRGGPGEPAQVRGRDDIIPSRDGRSLRNRRKDRRIVELRGWVRGSGATEDDQRADYWDNRLTLESWFSTTEARELVADLPNGDSYSLTTLVVPDVLYNQVVPAFAWVAIELESVDPDWALVAGS